MHQQTEWQLKCKCHLVASTLDTQRQVNAPVCDRDIAVNYWRGCPPQTGRSASISRKMPVRKLPNSGRLGGVGSGPATGGRWPDHLEAMMTVPWPRSDISTPPLPVSGHANFIRTQPSQGPSKRALCPFRPPGSAGVDSEWNLVGFLKSGKHSHKKGRNSGQQKDAILVLLIPRSEIFADKQKRPRRRWSGQDIREVRRPSIRRRCQIDKP